MLSYHLQRDRQPGARQDMAKASPTPAPPPRGSLTAQVLRDLTQRIERGELAPGDRLPPERSLMQSYGVSRTVVREAISSLRAGGRVDTQQGRGAFVLASVMPMHYALDPSDAERVGDVLQIMDLRLALETEAAAMVARSRTEAQMESIRAAFDQLAEDIGRGKSSVAADVRFHLEIVRATGNAYFRGLFEQLSPLLIPRGRVDLFRRDRAQQRRYLEGVQQEHAQIIGAIARRDPDAARAAVRLHLSNSRERLRAALEAAGGRDARRAGESGAAAPRRVVRRKR